LEVGEAPKGRKNIAKGITLGIVAQVKRGASTYVAMEWQNNMHRNINRTIGNRK